MQESIEKIMPLYYHLSKKKLDTLYKEKIGSITDKFINQDLFPNRKITAQRFYKRISPLQPITHESKS